MATPDRDNAGPPRDGRGRFQRTLAGVERDTEAARLRVQGLTFAEVAVRLGYADAAGAYRGVGKALAAVPVEAAAELRVIEAARLDALTVAAWEVAERRHPLVSNGRVVILDGEVLHGDAPVLAALGLLLRIQERRAKLLGLDAPAKQRVEVITEDMVDAAMRELEGEVAALEASVGADGAKERDGLRGD